MAKRQKKSLREHTAITGIQARLDSFEQTIRNIERITDYTESQLLGETDPIGVTQTEIDPEGSALDNVAVTLDNLKERLDSITNRLLVPIGCLQSEGTESLQDFVLDQVVEEEEEEEEDE